VSGEKKKREIKEEKMKKLLVLLVGVGLIMFLASGNNFAQEEGKTTDQGVEKVDQKAVETKAETTTQDADADKKAEETQTETPGQDAGAEKEAEETPAETTAKDVDTITRGIIFPWYPHWLTGVLCVLMGIVGALTTMFSLIGGAVPGTAGYLPLKTRMAMVAEWEKILDGLLQKTPRDTEEIKAVGMETNSLRDDVRKSQRGQYKQALVQYVFLGGAFAAMLSTNLLQALVIGAGWTAYLGSIGLKKDFADRKAKKDETIKELKEKVSPKEKEDRVLIMDIQRSLSL
jgi:hypothetical protein